jgi:hypothetical protein
MTFGRTRERAPPKGTGTGRSTASFGVSRERRLDWATGGITLLAYAIVQLALLQGPHPHDPAIYFKVALEFPDVGPGFFSLRIGLIAPVVASLFVFGPSVAALYAVPVAAGLVLVAAVYGTMLLLARDRVLAASAALATGLNAYYLLNSSFIFPDTVGTATFAAGFLCLVFGGTRLRGEDQGNGRASLFVISAGAFFGWTYLVRELSPILLPAVVAAALLLHYRLRHVAMLVGAAVASSSLELLYGLVRYGDPLVHLGLLFDRRERPVGVRRARMEHIQGQLNDVLDTIVVFPRLLLSWHVGWIFLLLLAVFVLALARSRDRRLWILGTWFFSFWAAMVVFGLVTLLSGRWILNITNIRYWYPIFPPLLMGAFLGVGLLFGKSSPSRRCSSVAGVAAAGVVGLTLVLGVVEFRRCAAKDPWRHDPAAGWKDLRSWFATPEAQRYDVVWADSSSHRLIPAFTRTTFGGRLWEGEVRPFPNGRADEVRTTNREASVLVINRDRRRLRPELSQLRREWSPIFVSENGRMLVLAAESTADEETAETVSAWWMPLDSEGTAREPGSCGVSPYEPA